MITEKTARRRIVPTLLCAMMAVSAIAASSCKRTIDMPVDPKLAAAFTATDAAFAAFDASQDQGAYTLSGQAGAALTELAAQLSAQQSKYSNPKQQLQLRNAFMAASELSVMCDNVDVNAGIEQLADLKEQWTRLRKDIAPFVGKAADAPQ